MATTHLEQRVAQLIDLFNARRFADYVAAFHERAVIEYPQSGERVHGRQDMLGMFTAFAAPPTFRVWRIDGAGDVVLVHAAAHYPGSGDWFALIEYQFEGDAVVRETAYFGAPFPPAEWRRPFVRVASFTDSA
jgi:hypothetical protein